ncbi:MAG: radical SAM family heme chaperone HemW, partial [Bacillota bacterium]
FVSLTIGRRAEVTANETGEAGAADLIRPYLAAVRREADRRAPELAGRTIEGVYFGGGTPTTLAPRDLAGLLEHMSARYAVDSRAEVTIEANPGTVDVARLKDLRAAGFNRLSLGAQAFQDPLLTRLGRAHDAAAIGAALAAARAAGFTDLNLDLIYGLPGQSADDWRATLRAAIALGPEHIAAYALKVEPGTPFHRDQAAGRLDLPGEDAEAAMYEEARETLALAGYEQYELSNWARPGHRSRHNLLYWHNQDYAGLGAAAWSHLGTRRRGNLRDVAEYVRLVEAGTDPVGEVEELDQRRAAGEAAFLALRLLDGLSLAEFAAEHGRSLEELFPGAIGRVTAAGLAALEGDRLCLTGRGLLLANQVFQEFVD